MRVVWLIVCAVSVNCLRNENEDDEHLYFEAKNVSSLIVLAVVIVSPAIN